MDFNNIITRLEKYSSTINKAIIGLAIFEAFLVILIGIVSNNLSTSNTTLNAICLSSLILCALIYLALLGIRTAYTASFPGSITNELKSERELLKLKRDASRQETINDFFVQTIQRLNGQTCALNLGDDTNLCDTGIQQGIYQLIQPVVDNAYFLLDTNNTNFTVGVYLQSYRSMQNGQDWESGVICIQDRLFKEHILNKDLLELDVQGEQLELKQSIEQCFNNLSFVKRDYVSNGTAFSIVCSPMPIACNEHEGLGVLFIISNILKDLPSEVSTNLTIFNRVIANWIYRYNECVNNRRPLNE